jgi:hypothetical protein
MSNNNLIKSKKRVRDHGEVFTPNNIVEAMLDLVKHETENIESRFLEPACGDGNFLSKILERKLAVVERKYKKSQFDYKRYAFLAASSIYGIDLLDDNVAKARRRLYDIVAGRYEKLYPKNINQDFLESIKFVLKKNIVQGDALSFKDKKGKPVQFSQWTAVNSVKIKRQDFQFVDLAEFDPKRPSLFAQRITNENGEIVFLPKSIEEYPPVNFLNLKDHDE